MSTVAQAQPREGTPPLFYPDPEEEERMRARRAEIISALDEKRALPTISLFMELARLNLLLGVV